MNRLSIQRDASIAAHPACFHGPPGSEGEAGTWTAVVDARAKRSEAPDPGNEAK